MTKYVCFFGGYFTAAFLVLALVCALIEGEFARVSHHLQGLFCGSIIVLILGIVTLQHYSEKALAKIVTHFPIQQLVAIGAGVSLLSILASGLNAYLTILLIGIASKFGSYLGDLGGLVTSATIIGGIYFNFVVPVRSGPMIARTIASRLPG